MQEKDLIKYIKGEASVEERKSVVDWIRSNVEHQERFNILKAQYVASTLDSLDIPDIDIPYKRFSAKRDKKRKYYYASIAAAILLPFFIWQTYTFFPTTNLITNTTEIFGFNTKNIATERGDYKLVILPDGSTITLNAKSSLKYPKKFTDSIREVTLVGEAFFDIKRDTTKPFIVHTEHLKIKVLGTSFNVKSYPKDEKIETTLVTGKVEVIQEKIEHPIILEPSQRATFDKEKSNLKVDSVNSKNVIAWRNGKLVFDRTPLKQVVSDLNRKYDVDFVIESDALLRYKFTGEFDNLTIEEVLKFLKLSSSINYKYVNNKIMLNSE